NLTPNASAPERAPVRGHPRELISQHVLRMFGPHIFSRSCFEERLRIRPLAELALEMPALVDEDLSVFGQPDPRPFERTRRRSLEIDARDTEAAAVTRTLELVFRRQVVRRATQVRAGDA